MSARVADFAAYGNRKHAERAPRRSKADASPGRGALTAAGIPDRYFGDAARPPAVMSSRGWVARSREGPCGRLGEQTPL
jgi:hypothetical protein